MTGYVDVVRRPFVSIVLRGGFGSHRLEAMVDTGFNGYIAVPESLPHRLGLPRQGNIISRVGDGRVRRLPTFIGEVDWLSGAYRCQFIAAGLSHALVGTALLTDQTLTIDFGPGKTVEIR